MGNETGLHFERWLATIAGHQGWEVIKIPTGAKFIGKGKHVPVKSPFDFIFQRRGQVIFCDAKSTELDRLKFSKVNRKQVFELRKLLPLKIGYIVEFRKVGKIGFIPAQRLMTVQENESVVYNEVVHLGTHTDFRLERVFDGAEDEEIGHGTTT